MFDLIKLLFTSTKPHHVISGSLFLMLSFAIFHVYGEQEKMNERKADNASVERMLQQELLKAQFEKQLEQNLEILKQIERIRVQLNAVTNN